MQTVTKTIDSYGHTFYRNKKDQLHNETGPAYIGADGSMQYWINDKLHRIDGPAIIWSDGAVEYYINDKLHRIDGPAIIWSDGSMSYYINGKYLTKDQFEAQTTTKFEVVVKANGEVTFSLNGKTAWAKRAMPAVLNFINEINEVSPELEAAKSTIVQNLANKLNIPIVNKPLEKVRADDLIGQFSVMINGVEFVPKVK